MNDSLRRSGRTRAQLEGAAVQARAGKHVLFVVHTGSMANYARAMVQDLLKHDGWEKPAHRFGFGSLRIVEERYADRIKQLGRAGRVVVVDHAWGQR